MRVAVATLLPRATCLLALTSMLEAAGLGLEVRAAGLGADLHASTTPHIHAAIHPTRYANASDSPS